MKPAPPPLDYAGFVADALHDAMLVRDVQRVIAIGRLAADLVDASMLVEIAVERQRRAMGTASKGAPRLNPEVRK